MIQWGTKFTSKENGNCIFLPAAGSRIMTYTDIGSLGWYWTSSLFPNDSSIAYPILFSSRFVTYEELSVRSTGMSVRPVYAQ